MRYLEKTKYFLFVFHNRDGLEIVGYVDSNLVGSHDDMKSSFSYVFKIGW